MGILENKNTDLFESYNNLVDSFFSDFKRYYEKASSGSELKKNKLNCMQELDKIKQDKMKFRVSYIEEMKAKFIAKGLVDIDAKILELKAKLEQNDLKKKEALGSVNKEDIERNIKKNYEQILEIKENSQLIDDRFKKIFGNDLYQIADELSKSSLDDLSYEISDLSSCEADLVSINNEIDFEKSSKYIDYEKYLKMIFGVPEWLKGLAGPYTNYIYCAFWLLVIACCIAFTTYVLVPAILIIMGVSVSNFISNKRLLNAFIKSHKIFTFLDEATSSIDSQIDSELNAKIAEINDKFDTIDTLLKADLIEVENDKIRKTESLVNEFNPLDCEADIENQYALKIKNMEDSIVMWDKKLSNLADEVEASKTKLLSDYEKSGISFLDGLITDYFQNKKYMMNPNGTIKRLDNIYFPKSLFYQMKGLGEGYLAATEHLGIKPLRKVETLKINRRASVIFYSKDVQVSDITTYVRDYIHEQLLAYMKTGMVKFSFMGDTPEAYFEKLSIVSDRPDERKNLSALKMYTYYNPNKESEMLKTLHGIASANRSRLTAFNNFKTFEDYNEYQSSEGIGGQTNPTEPYNVFIYYKYSNNKVLNTNEFIDILSTTGGNKDSSQVGGENVGGIIPLLFLNTEEVFDPKGDVDVWLKLLEYIHNDNVFEISPNSNQLGHYSRDEVIEKLNQIKGLKERV